MTPNRSAGRIEDDLWVPFLRKAHTEGLSNTDAMRRMMRHWLGMPEPVSLEDTGSSSDGVASAVDASRPGV